MTIEQRFELADFTGTAPGSRPKRDVFKGNHFNVVVICLDDGYRTEPHHEPFDVLAGTEDTEARTQ